MMWFTQVHQHLPKTVDSKVEELAHVNSWEAERGGTAERRTPKNGRSYEPGGDSHDDNVVVSSCEGDQRPTALASIC
jgi:hypothetical protein